MYKLKNELRDVVRHSSFHTHFYEYNVLNPSLFFYEKILLLHHPNKIFLWRKTKSKRTSLNIYSKFSKKKILSFYILLSNLALMNEVA